MNSAASPPAAAAGDQSPLPRPDGVIDAAAGGADEPDGPSGAIGSRGSGPGVASLVIAVAFVGLFGPLVQYLPLVIPAFGLVLGSTEGSYALLGCELAGMVVALVLGVAAIVTRRGRGYGIAAVVIALTVGAYLLQIFIPFGGRG